MTSIPQTHDTGTVSNYDTLRPMLKALDEAERALWPAGRTLCATCGTHAEMCLLTAALEDEGRYVVPVPCGRCGAWRVAPETSDAQAIEDARELDMIASIRCAYPSLYVTTWIALIRHPQTIPAAHCAIALPDGYAVHAVLSSGRLGGLVRRYRYADEVTR